MNKTESTMNFQAGKLTALFDRGNLRFIKFADQEVLSMIYFAVRDANWGTARQIIQNVETKTTEQSFEITFDCICQENDIDFRWKCKISGQKDHLTFEIKGRAYSNFRKNRIGFCILHPLNCKDRKITITHTNGSQTETRFPYHISPHQPFIDITAMSWKAGALDCHIDFAGDIFETEDQRNWSDASFKTYCTPLDLPFPVHMLAGDEVHQTITLTITEKHGQAPVIPIEKHVLEIENGAYAIPSIGLEANEEPLDGLSVEMLKSLNLSHLRIEARTHEENWQQGFRKRLLQAKQLHLQVELVIFLKEKYQQNLKMLHEQLDREVTIKSILPIDTTQKATSEEFLQLVLPEIVTLFKRVPVGGGTDCYFTEFNRFRPPFHLVDFVSFSTNPQVHAFDDISLIETIQTLPDMLETTRYLAKDLPVHISPVTLKPRFNPDATMVIASDNQVSLRLDRRHNKAFNALWTMGCLKQLVQSGAGLVTFFQTAGEEGTLMPGRSSASEHYSASDHEVFPIFELFKILGEFKGGKVIHTTSSDPLAFEGIVLEKGIHKTLLLANFTENRLSVEVEKEFYTIMPKKLTPFHL